MPRFLLCLLAAVVVAPAGLHAQSEEQAVLQVVKRLFDGMRTRDTTLMRAQLDPTARMIAITPEQKIATIDPSRWIGGVGKATGDAYDERIFDPEVRVDDNIATVWTYYEFWLGPKLSHCGIDAFFLAKTSAGWKVNQVADTRRKDCTPRK